MMEGTFLEYWNQAQFCYFKAEAAKGPASKHLWIQMAQDWIALAEKLMSQAGQLDDYHPMEELEPDLVA